MKKAAFLFFRVEVGNAACAVQYLVVVQTMLVRCPKNLDFTVFQKVSLSNLIFDGAGANALTISGVITRQNAVWASLAAVSVVMLIGAWLFG